MEILSILMANPAMQAAILGTGVKLVVDQLKGLFKQVDANGLPDGYKMPVQLMVMICSGLATLGDLALKGQLSGFDTNLLVNFVTVSVPAFIAAWSIHNGSKVVLEKTVGRETLLKK